MSQAIHCPACHAPLSLREDEREPTVHCPWCQAAVTVRPPAQGRFREGLPEDEYEDGDEVDEWLRRPRGRRVALHAVSAPATVLMITAGLDVLVGCFYMFLGMVFLAVALDGNRSETDRLIPQVLASVLALVGLLAIIKSIFVLLGALCLKRLIRYGFARTTVILAIVPIGSFWFLSIPVGIWALVTLSRPEVKEAFQNRT